MTDQRAAAERMVHEWVEYWDFDGLSEGARGDMMSRIADALLTREGEVRRLALEEAARIVEGPGGFDLDNDDHLQRRYAAAIRARAKEARDE